MELTHEFSVDVPLEQAWTVLTDLERVAPCMPGFELQGVEGDEYRGVVVVKVGPMVARYQGAASFQERDEAGHRAVVRAEGRETRGQGRAAATVTATLAPRDGGTHVALHTDLKITGRVAQFGRGVLVDVSSKLLRQFVEALEADVLTGAGRTDAGAEPAARGSGRTAGEPGGPDAAHDGGREAPVSTPRPAGTRSNAPVDLVAAAGPSVLKRLGPILLLLLAVALWLVVGR